MKIRNLYCSLNRGINGACNRRDSRMLDGRRRPRPTNELASVCRFLTEAIRISERMAKNDPHVFGPHARAYFLETLQMEKTRREARAALEKVYGPPSSAETPLSSSVWTDRYVTGPSHGESFRKWFKEHYG